MQRKITAARCDLRVVHVLILSGDASCDGDPHSLRRGRRAMRARFRGRCQDTAGNVPSSTRHLSVSKPMRHNPAHLALVFRVTLLVRSVSLRRFPLDCNFWAWATGLRSGGREGPIGYSGLLCKVAWERHCRALSGKSACRHTRTNASTMECSRYQYSCTVCR